MSISDVFTNSSEIISNYDNIIGNLTLYGESLPQDVKNDLPKKLLDRPITPIELEIKGSPKSLEEFLSLFRRRVTIDKMECLSEKDQQNMLGIIEQEIRIAWPQLTKLLNYPLFNKDQNEEMRRLIFLTIILNCNDSFNNNKEKALYYNKKDIFSEEANMIRVRLQLAEDIKNKLHIPKLRRHIFQSITEGNIAKHLDCCDVPSIDKVEKKFQEEIHDINRRINSENESELHTSSIYKIVKIYERTISQNDLDGLANVIESPFDSPYDATQTINDKIIAVESTANRRVSNETDLKNLLIGNIHEIKDQDSFPQISEVTLSIKPYKNLNEKLRQKINLLRQKNKLLKENESFTPKKPSIVQPSSIPISYKNKVYFLGDIRPTSRRNDCDISLTINGPLWNELADEITPDIVKIMDCNLFRGEEVKDIYKEMMKTVSHDHLNYTQDALFENCPSKINIHEILSSSTLSNEFKKERVINPNLKTMTQAPWEVIGKSRLEWQHPNYNITGSSSNDMDLKHYVELSKENISHQKYLTGSSYGGSMVSAINTSRDQNTFSFDNFRDPVSSSRDTPIKVSIKKDYVVNSDKFAQGLLNMPRLMQDRLIKQYNEWLNSWKNTYSMDDYMKYLNLQSTDFLSVIFHNFESKDDDEESNDSYVSSEILEQRHIMLQREMERKTILQEKIQELEWKKHDYTPGLWNPSSIFIGGLGKIPTLSDIEINEILRNKPQLEDPDEKIRKMSAYSRGRSAVSNSKPVELFIKKTKTKSQSNDDETNVNSKISIIQTRLENIWSNLKMPNHKRLDMTIKYASGEALKYIETILHQWEITTNLVVERETALMELEKFERIASDPNRFFVKGYRGSSMARLEESKIRTNLGNMLDEVTSKTENAIEDLKSICGDDLTYGGRLYTDKIKYDRTEMLYWLQEERKELCIRNISNIVFIK